jgi:hypothetical protein
LPDHRGQEDWVNYLAEQILKEKRDAESLSCTMISSLLIGLPSTVLALIAGPVGAFALGAIASQAIPKLSKTMSEPNAEEKERASFLIKEYLAKLPDEGDFEVQEGEVLDYVRHEWSQFQPEECDQCIRNNDTWHELDL